MAGPRCYDTTFIRIGRENDEQRNDRNEWENWKANDDGGCVGNGASDGDNYDFDDSDKGSNDDSDTVYHDDYDDGDIVDDGDGEGETERR